MYVRHTTLDYSCFYVFQSQFYNNAVFMYDIWNLLEYRRFYIHQTLNITVRPNIYRSDIQNYSTAVFIYVRINLKIPPYLCMSEEQH